MVVDNGPTVPDTITVANVELGQAGLTELPARVPADPLKNTVTITGKDGTAFTFNLPLQSLVIGETVETSFDVKRSANPLAAR